MTSSFYSELYILTVVILFIHFARNISVYLVSYCNHYVTKPIDSVLAMIGSDRSKILKTWNVT